MAMSLDNPLRQFFRGDGERTAHLPDGTQILRIAPDSKWAIILPEDVTKDQARQWAEALDEWWKAPQAPFTIFIADIKLVRVDRDEA